MTKTKEILNERQNTHGDFSDNAHYSQALKYVVVGTKNWEAMTDTQREALDMILHKISRICAGNADEPDHWLDISGYATLVAERLNKVQ